MQAEFASAVPSAIVNAFGAPAVDGLGAAGGLALVIQDPIDSGATALELAANETATQIETEPGIQDAFSGFRANTPWLRLDVDRVAAESRGVSNTQIVNALQIYFGSLYINDFNWQGRTWQVNVQAEGHFRHNIADLKHLEVATATKEMVPLGSIIKIEECTGPVTVQRYNLYPAAILTITPKPGVSSGDAMAQAERAVAASLPTTMKSEWTELALLQKQTSNTASRAFALAVVLAFLVLAAQYESWSLPLAVILVVPLCLLSATVGVLQAGHDVNIFTQIGFVVLVGLACKNAILIVEFAKHRHESGATLVEATLEACQLRLRPIIMTSVAFILGVVPLVIATGAGAEMRRPLGTAVFAGMTGVTLFGLVLTPVFFYVIQYLVDWQRQWRGEPTAPESIESTHKT